MDSLYEMPIARPPGRPPVIDDPAHSHLRGQAAGMRRAGKSRREIARELGVSRRTLWRWEQIDRPRDVQRA